MRKDNRQAGFTLIELLIVVAIIAILASVLIPNILNARTRAFDAATQAHGKNLITMVAAADAGGNPLTTGVANCMTGITGATGTTDAAKLANEGAVDAPAQSVSTCAITVDNNSGRVTVTVKSKGNKTFTFTY